MLPSLALALMAQLFNPPLGSPPFASEVGPNVSYEPGLVTVAASPDSPSLWAAWIDDRNGLPGRSQLVWVEAFGIDGGSERFLGVPATLPARLSTLRLATGLAGQAVGWTQSGALGNSVATWWSLVPDGGRDSAGPVTGFDLAVLPTGVVAALVRGSSLSIRGALEVDRGFPSVGGLGAVAITPLGDGGLVFALERIENAGSSVLHASFKSAATVQSNGRLLGLAPGTQGRPPVLLLTTSQGVLRLEAGSSAAPVFVTGSEAILGTVATDHVALVGGRALGTGQSALTWNPIADGGGPRTTVPFEPTSIATTGQFVLLGGPEGDDVVAEWRDIGGSGGRRVLNVGPAARRHPTVAWNGTDFVASAEVRGLLRDHWRGAVGTPGGPGEATLVGPTPGLEIALVQRTAHTVGLTVRGPQGSELRELDGGAVALSGVGWTVADGLPTLAWRAASAQVEIEGAQDGSLAVASPRCVASVGGGHLFIGASGASLHAWRVPEQGMAVELAPLDVLTVDPAEAPSVCTKPSFATNELLAAWADGQTLRVVVYDGTTFTIRESVTLMVPDANPRNPIAMRVGSAIGVAWELGAEDDIGFGLVRDGRFERTTKLLGPSQGAFGVSELSMASNPEGTRLAIVWSALDPRVRARVLGGRIVGVPLVADAGVVEPEDGGVDAGVLPWDGGAGEPPDAGGLGTTVERFRPECGCHAPGGLALLGLAFLLRRMRR